jgi:hypothetical protein
MSGGEKDMAADEFLLWFGDQLEAMNSIPEADQRLEKAQLIVSAAFSKLDQMANPERIKVLASFQGPFISRVGNYLIPYDESKRDDWVAGVLATINGHYADNG